MLKKRASIQKIIIRPANEEGATKRGAAKFQEKPLSALLAHLQTFIL